MEQNGTETRTKLLDTHSLGQYLGTSDWSVRNLKRKGKLPFVKIGRRIFYDRDEIDAWIKRNSQPEVK
ncbi:MAG: helix-turn-helix domain-containing protein [Ignavibacteriales bacterium]